MKRRTHGFSLIELLIVVAIILIVVAMAVPSLNRARIAANSASAANSVRQIHSAEVTYLNTYGGFATDLIALGPGAGQNSCPAAGPSSTAACLLDSSLSNNAANNGKSGYMFAAAGAGAGNAIYGAGAAPVTYNATGIKRYCITADGAIRVDINATGSGTVDVLVATCEAPPYLPL